MDNFLGGFLLFVSVFTKFGNLKCNKIIRIRKAELQLVN